MRFLLNVLWMILGGGFLIWLEYVVVGMLLCLTVIGIPFGLQCFKIAKLGLFPFGKDYYDSATGLRPVSGLLNVLWLVCAGIWIFLSHVALGLAAAATIIGIPFALQHLKLGMLALMPFGKIIRER